MDSRIFTLDANTKLGSGSYGSVYTGSMIHQGKRINIAVKRIENDGLGNFYADSGRKEYDILMAIGQHENVVKLLGFESDKHFLYILMELGTEGNLEEYLENSKALHYMHTRHPPIVHRDIKSENVIIHRSDNGQIIAKMADFGQSRVFDPEGKKQFMSTDRGCLLFKSPELFTRGRKQYTCAVDTFSMGLVFMVMLNYTENKKCLEPTPVSLQDSPMLFYGQRLSLANEQKTPWPVLFSLTSDDCFPVTELKTLITLMTRYRPENRIKMQHVESVLKAIITNAHRKDVHSLVAYLENDRLNARTETETLQERISSQQLHLCSLQQQNHELNNKVEKLKDQVRRRDDQLTEDEGKVGAALKQLKTALSDVFQPRLSDEMSTKLSRDESSLENVSIKNRPMNITTEYQQLCSEQWLEAKAAIDEATASTRYTEKDKLKFILDIFMNAQERATEIVERSNSEQFDLLLNPLGKKQSLVFGMRDKGTYDESQVPDKVKNTIHDFKRTTLESMDLSELVQQIEKTLDSYGIYSNSVGYEVKYQREAKKSVLTLVSAIVSLVWKMVNQRPVMKFDTPGVNEQFDPNIQDIHWGSPYLHGRGLYVDVYSHPVLMHGDKVMAKGKVLIKERY